MFLIPAPCLLVLCGVGAAHAAAPLDGIDAGMVVTSQHLASDVGAAVLRQGGNAIDAAVAVGYALAVTHPCCGNLGGGGFMTIHLADGRNTFINFREKAPLAARADMFLDASGNADRRQEPEWLSRGRSARDRAWDWKRRARDTARCRARR